MKALDVPALPSGKRVPSTEEMVDLLVRALPEADRAEATGLLREIVSAKLVDVDSHPRPRRLAEEVYDEVAERLREAHPEDRLPALRDATLHARVQAIGSQALAMAVARYLNDHPEAGERASAWTDESVASWKAKSDADIQREATHQLSLLEEWAGHVQQDRPELWEQDRIEYTNAKLALQSARSGAFGTAAGSLSDFLRAVGAPAKDLHIH